MKDPSGSPYLRGDHRLADVIAAIQATGAYRYYKLDFATWADRITGDSTQAGHWRSIFEDHPEFFRLDSRKERASLVLRRQRPKRYNVDDDTVWPRDRLKDLTDEQKARFSRLPLSASEIEALIDVAINLHTRAAERARDKRWWAAPALGFAGALLGGVAAKLIEVSS